MTLRPLAFAWLIGSTIVVARSADADRSPFVPRASIPEISAPAADPLAGHELAGVSVLGGETSVCVVESRTRRGLWLVVGAPGSPFAAERYDPDRQAALIRVGDQTRWVALRQATVAAMPVVYRADRTIDHDHMRLTERQKEVKAALQHWEMLEVSRLGRLDEPPVPAGQKAAATASSSSQQR